MYIKFVRFQKSLYLCRQYLRRRCIFANEMWAICIGLSSAKKVLKNHSVNINLKLK